LAKFINLLDTIELGEDPFFGKSNFAPTLITTSETSSNIIPAQLTLTIDFRNVFSDTPEVVEKKLQKIVDKCSLDEPDVTVTIEIIKNKITCYTGLTKEAFEGEPAFEIKRDHEMVQTAKNSLDQALDKDVEVIVWDFATDSGHFIEAGIPTIGFSPADALMCHTTEERIDIDMMKEGLIGYMALLSSMGNCKS
jgi:acetylornithine deacetylase/succinyl-diaminopimelate desuccinylase-like protein